MPKNTIILILNHVRTERQGSADYWVSARASCTCHPVMEVRGGSVGEVFLPTDRIIVTCRNPWRLCGCHVYLAISCGFCTLQLLHDGRKWW